MGVMVFLPFLLHCLTFRRGGAKGEVFGEDRGHIFDGFFRATVAEAAGLEFGEDCIYRQISKDCCLRKYKQCRIERV